MRKALNPQMDAGMHSNFLDGQHCFGVVRLAHRSDQFLARKRIPKLPSILEYHPRNGFVDE